MVDNLDLALPSITASPEVEPSRRGRIAARIIVIKVRKALGKRQKLDNLVLRRYLDPLDPPDLKYVTRYVTQQAYEFEGPEGLVSYTLVWNYQTQCFEETQTLHA